MRKRKPNKNKGWCHKGHKLVGDNHIRYSASKSECRTCRRERDKRYQAKRREERSQRRRAGNVQRERPIEPAWHRMLPVEPITVWLHQRMEESGLDCLNFARRHGVSDKKIQELYAGRLAEVKLDTIDRILVEAGETGVLEELYPLEALRDTA
jgi:hypothetical protein